MEIKFDQEVGAGPWRTLNGAQWGYFWAVGLSAQVNEVWRVRGRVRAGQGARGRTIYFISQHCLNLMVLMLETSENMSISNTE